MTVSIEILESIFDDFVAYIRSEKNEDFTSFKDLKFIDIKKTGENYKYNVHNLGREKLDSQSWKANDIGSGRIHENTTKALYVEDNNLVNNYRLKQNFENINDTKTIEQILFDFYKSKILDSISFEKFIDFGISYNVVAYLFFLKEKNKYLPISQRAFDNVFELIGLSDFKTDGQNSFDNYSQFCDLIKQVQRFLKTKDKETTLIDAHSFLWIVGQMNTKSVKNETSKKETKSKSKIISEKNGTVQSKDTKLNDSKTTINQYNEKLYPDDFSEESIEELYEGLKKTITVNSYERNSTARQSCIDYWKAICAVCSADFEKLYGEIGKGFIHVHHLTPISKVGQTYQIDPINDLIPVCPNCHSMLHRKEPPLTIDELKKMIVQK